jgi:hypothetical protein
LKNALVQLEDIGPGAPYDTPESLQNLRVIADFLKSQNVPFRVSLIPRFVNPTSGYDKAVDQTSDPYIQSFNATIDYLIAQGGQVNMQGFTHQFGQGVSGTYEFFTLNCTANCAPDDPIPACSDRTTFINSYASSRMGPGFATTKGGGFTPLSFTTPGHAASDTQRCIIESWAGVFDEEDPQNNVKRTITIRDTDAPFYRGVVYLPTDLGFVHGADPQGSVNRICAEVQTLADGDLAGVFFHPFLDFPFISGSTYASNSYLHQIIACIKNAGFTFQTVGHLVSFSPSSRATSFFPGAGTRVFAADMTGDGKADLLVYEPDKGNWHFVIVGLPFPARQFPLMSLNTVLTNWAKGTFWVPLIGDVDGDGLDDVVVYNPAAGTWQVSISNGAQLNPSPGPGNFLWLQNFGVGSFWVPFVGDFNGDGKDDVMVWNPQAGTWAVALSNGSEFIPSPGPTGNFTWLQGWAVGTFWVPRIGDFNGDGKDDIVVLNPNDGSWQVALSTGSQFVPNAGAHGNFLWLENFAAGSNWTPLVGDFNGDGKSDVLAVDVSAGSWQVALSSGSQFLVTPPPFFPWAADSATQPLAADFTGDGRTDICARNPILRGGTVDFAVSFIGQ